MFEYWAYCMDNKFYELHLGKSDYGWASLYQIKKLSQIGLTYDYEYYFHIIYDTVIDKHLIDTFLTNEKCILFPSNKGFEVGGFFMGFNKNVLSLFKKSSLYSQDILNIKKNTQTKYYIILPWLLFFLFLSLFHYSNVVRVLRRQWSIFYK